MQQQPACEYCRARKRRCDRQTPRCGLCDSKGQDCVYERANPARSFVTTHNGSLFTDRSPLLSQFPTSLFLDKELFIHENFRFSPSSLVLSDEINELLSSPSTISERYFLGVHLWMPIISKRRWLTHHLNPLAPPENHIQVLLLCMSIMTWRPGSEHNERDALTVDYMTAKRILYDAEHCGAMSLQLLQAQILVVIYEYGHGIYPAAYMTIAACARYAIALGIHKLKHEDNINAHIDFEEQEERRRVWWAIIILDCILSPEVSCCPEPHADDLLPVNDEMWENGTSNEAEIYTVSSTANAEMGTFAQLAQASCFLSRVLHQKRAADHGSVSSEDHMQLLQAFRSFLKLTIEDSSIRLMPKCPQAYVSFSAILILTGIQSHGLDYSSASEIIQFDNDKHGQQSLAQNMDLLQQFADGSLLSTQGGIRDKPWSFVYPSPLFLHYAYLIAIAFLKLSRSASNTSLMVTEENRRSPTLDPEPPVREIAAQGLRAMRSKLNFLGQQWCAAEQYLHLLDLRSNMS